MTVQPEQVAELLKSSKLKAIKPASKPIKIATAAHDTMSEQEKAGIATASKDLANTLESLLKTFK